MSSGHTCALEGALCLLLHPPRCGLLKTWATQDRLSRWINSKEEKSRFESFNLSSASEKSCPPCPTLGALPQQAGVPPSPGVLSIPSLGQAKIIYLKIFSKLFRHTKNGECLAIQPNPLLAQVVAGPVRTRFASPRKATWLKFRSTS